MTPLAIWQETAGPESAPTDIEIIRALRSIWRDAEAAIDEAQTELASTSDPFAAARRLDAAIDRALLAEDWYTRAWSAYCAARRVEQPEPVLAGSPGELEHA